MIVGHDLRLADSLLRGGNYKLAEDCNEHDKFCSRMLMHISVCLLA